MLGQFACRPVFAGVHLWWTAAVGFECKQCVDAAKLSFTILPCLLACAGITDGLYGSFNCILYDGQNPGYQVVRSPLLPPPTSSATFKSTLWGPTCDSADCVYKDHELPELRNGDWLLFPNAGEL
jgi:hypothetical protein